MNGPSALVGYIHHVISEGNCSQRSAGKKRPRPWDGSRGKDDTGSTSNVHKGFIFIPEEQRSGEDSPGISPLSSLQPQTDGYPIIIPYQWLRIACTAAATGELVRVSQYSLIRYRNGCGELVFSSRDNGASTNGSLEGANNGKDDGKLNEFVAIEVHRGGLRLASSGTGENVGKQLQGEGNAVPTSMSLEDLSRREAEAQQPRDTQGKKKKKSPAFGKEPMNVVGVVDAISPILVNDSGEEPFAILELYQPLVDETNSDVKSAVAIIRGEKALCVHPSIHPGQSVTLVGVVSRKWKVPDEMKKHFDKNEAAGNRNELYQRLQNRVPERVILVTEASLIHWNNGHGPARRLDTSLPSTVESLTSLRGVVTSVHFHFGNPQEGRKASPVVHFVALKLLTPTEEVAAEQNLARLYLPKYAISPTLALGMQPGAVLRAVNIHFVSPSTNSVDECDLFDEVDADYLCYVACLRSAVAIEHCAGESYNRSRSSHPWFITQQKPFLLVPDHRITEICADPFSTKSSVQYLAEEELRSQLEPKLKDFSQSLTNSAEYAQCSMVGEEGNERKTLGVMTTMPKLDALFLYHRCNVTPGKRNCEKYQNKGCSGVKRKSNRVNGRENGRQSLRDPYAEFFDHAHSCSLSSEVECGSSCNEFSSYSRRHHSFATNVPLVFDLESLRDACALNFINRVALYLRSNLRSVGSGWTSSFFYHGLKLGQVLNDYSRSQGALQSNSWYSDDSMTGIYSWGQVEVNAADPTSDVAWTTVRDNSCAIPVCEFQNDASGDLGLQLESVLPAWVELGSVIVSCLCLGSSQKDLGPSSPGSDQSESDSARRSPSHQIVRHAFLPSMPVECKESSNGGHAFLFRVDNLVFIGSVHIVSKSMVSVACINGKSIQCGQAIGFNGKTNASSSLQTNADGALNIKECLEQTAAKDCNGSPSLIAGRLVRQRYNFRKLKSVQRRNGQQKPQAQKCYDGWTVILSHIDSATTDLMGVASVLQTIEVKLSVPFGKSTTLCSGALDTALLRLVDSGSSESLAATSNKVITPDQVTLAIAWWSASEDSRTWPLLSGGWDELKDQVFVEKALAPSIHVHIPLASRTFSKLGYQRFRCHLNEIKSVFVLERGNSTVPKDAAGAHRSRKFLPGMLNRRLRRMPPLLFNTEQGVGKEPVYRCRNPQSPLTRLQCQGGIPSATLAELHWDICAALREGNAAHLKPSLLRRVHNPKILGISFCRAHVECTQCFKALARSNQPTSHAQRNSTKAELSCPSGCSHSHAAVKWECSAVIDDGTGQAKVYAEREGALLLLGGSLDVASVESGAWESETGIFFQPALPASSRLMNCIRDATTQARKCAVQRKSNKRDKRQSQTDSPPSALSLLPADAKAEYLLHHHCRQWYQNHHNRRMDLFVRCKPLSEDATTVNHTEIQVAKAWTKVGLDFGTASTATLPPLKLSLEDACVASADSSDDNATGWNLLKSI